MPGQPRRARCLPGPRERWAGYARRSPTLRDSRRHHSPRQSPAALKEPFGTPPQAHEGKLHRSRRHHKAASCCPPAAALAGFPPRSWSLRGSIGGCQTRRSAHRGSLRAPHGPVPLAAPSPGRSPELRRLRLLLPLLGVAAAGRGPSSAASPQRSSRQVPRCSSALGFIGGSGRGGGTPCGATSGRAATAGSARCLPAPLGGGAGGVAPRGGGG